VTVDPVDPGLIADVKVKSMQCSGADRAIMRGGFRGRHGAFVTPGFHCRQRQVRYSREIRCRRGVSAFRFMRGT
jgi:hypothetical protein